MRKQIIMRKTEELTIEEAFEIFLRKAYVRNLSENTIKTYQGHYKIFCKYANSNGLIADLTEESIDDFILFLKENSNANDITINSYLSTIRSFLYFCMDSGYLERYKIDCLKTEKKIKETYTDEELKRLLKKPDMKSCSFTEYKAWVFENYLLGTGNRISTALNVKIGDINFEDSIIIIRKTKNRKQQIIPLSRGLQEVLKEYLTHRGGNEQSFLFCNIYGEKGARRAYQQLVQEYNRERNVSKTSCHLFRHTFAKHWILSGGDIFRLQKILGHSDLEITKEYVQMFGNDLQIDFDKFNPLDCFQKKNGTGRITMW